MGARDPTEAVEVLDLLLKFFGATPRNTPAARAFLRAEFSLRPPRSSVTVLR
jgi:hypothetical protein